MSETTTRRRDGTEPAARTVRLHVPVRHHLRDLRRLLRRQNLCSSRVLHVGGPDRRDDVGGGWGELGRQDRARDEGSIADAGDVIDLPEGTMAFNDVMVCSLFAEVWDRDVLDVRSGRLLLMGVIAALGQSETWRIQARASLRNGELIPDELRETLIMLASYAGYPNVAPLVMACEEVIAAWQSDGEPGPAPAQSS